jgi:Flp pilus assembly protein TadG
MRSSNFSRFRSSAPPSRLARALGRFLRHCGGASALEFAIVATPLILLLLGVLEVGLVYLATFSLEHAVAQGARLVRTGQASEWDAATFKQHVCDALVPPVDCSGVVLDVRSDYSSFANITLDNPLDANGNLKTSFPYEPGAGGDIVVVRAYYDWDLIAKFPQGIALSNMPDGDRLLIATAVFRNEPF